MYASAAVIKHARNLDPVPDTHAPLDLGKMELKVCFVSLQTQGTTTYEEKHHYLFIN
jgi:hypothetical protein